jgi:hypothetical protein
MSHNIPGLILLGQTALLLITSGLLLYPVVAYARNVAYTEGIVFLALAFFATTAVGVLDFVFGATTVANGVRLLGAAFGLVGVWYFSRDFVNFFGGRQGDFGEHFEDFGGGEDE